MTASYEQALWFLGRATGFVSLFMLVFVFALGIAVHAGARPKRVPAFAMTHIHRNAALLAVVFLVVHVASVVIDPYVPLRVIDAVVPFVSSYRPFWLGLGTLALDLVAAVVVTSLVRVRLGRRAWKAVHWTAYALVPLTVVHSIGTGTDASSGLWLAVTLACAVAAAALVWWRCTIPAPPARRRRPVSSPAPTARQEPASRTPVGAHRSR